MKNTKDNIILTDSIYNSPVTADEIKEFEDFFKTHPILDPIALPGVDSDATYRINLSGTNIKVTGANPGVLLNNECYVAKARSTLPSRDGYNIYYMVSSGVMGYGVVPSVENGNNFWSSYGWGNASNGYGKLFKVRRTSNVFNPSGYFDFTLPAGSVVSSWCQSGENYPYLMRITSYKKPNESIIATNSYIDTGLRSYSGKNNMNVYGNW